MNTCKTCKYWKKNPYEDYIIDVRKCYKIPEYWEATDWGEDEEGMDIRELKEEYKDTKAFTQDASDYRSDLLTMENFGCVMWEEGE